MLDRDRSVYRATRNSGYSGAFAAALLLYSGRSVCFPPDLASVAAGEPPPLDFVNRLLCWSLSTLTGFSYFAGRPFHERDGGLRRRGRESDPRRSPGDPVRDHRSTSSSSAGPESAGRLRRRMRAAYRILPGRAVAALGPSQRLINAQCAHRGPVLKVSCSRPAHHPPADVQPRVPSRGARKAFARCWRPAPQCRSPRALVYSPADMGFLCPLRRRGWRLGW